MSIVDTLVAQLVLRPNVRVFATWKAESGTGRLRPRRVEAALATLRAELEIVRRQAGITSVEHITRDDIV